MAIFRKAALAAAVGGALLLGGCATGPYYDNYGYNGGYGYGYEQPYYGPAYVEPSVGFGVGFADYGGDRHWHHDHDGDRWHGDRSHDWRGGGSAAGEHAWQGGDRGDWRNDHGQNSGG